MASAALLLAAQCLGNTGVFTVAMTEREHVENPADQFEMNELFAPLVELLSVRRNSIARNPDLRRGGGARLPRRCMSTACARASAAPQSGGVSAAPLHPLAPLPRRHRHAARAHRS
jgi:hypothetical protein